MSKKIKVLLLACVLAVICCVGFTVGATDEAKAEVKGHSLTITDTGISVNFYVAIQGDVQVTLNENEVDLSTMETEKIVIDAKAYDCYIFTEAVAAKEMGDVVTLKIVSGTTPLINDSYRVNDYVAEVQKGGYNYNFESLANAMTYYGEFAEVYFGYNGATSVSPNANSYIEDFKESYFDSYAASVNTANMPDGLEFYGTMLNLNSKTTLRLLFTVDGKEASSFGTFTANGEDLGQLKPYKTYYYVDIEGIGAAQLDKAYAIECGGKEIISNCSVLTYARAAVKSSTKESLVNLSKALYLYNQKANTYVDAQAHAVYDMFYGNDGFSATPGTRTPIYLTDNGDVTREAAGNKEVKELSQLNGKRIKGCSVWMEATYPVAGTEEISGPYVIRRYENNKGSLLNVTGEATFTATVDVNTGDFAAKHPGGIDEFTISNAVKNEVAVSGTLKVTGSAKTGVITTSSADVTINAEGLTADGEIVFPNHTAQKLTGNGKASAIKLVDNGEGHFGAIETENGLILGSIICVCGKHVTEHEELCEWAKAQTNGLEAAYNIPWQAWNPTPDQYSRVGLPSVTGSYYLTEDFPNLRLRAEIAAAAIVNLDLAGHVAKGPGQEDLLCRSDGILNIADSSKAKTGAIIATGQATKTDKFGRVLHVWGNKNSSACINLYGGKIGATEETTSVDGLVRIRQGQFNMYGGEVGTCVSDSGSNCISVGVANLSCALNIQGGTIRGEVNVNDKDVTVTIGRNAKIGRDVSGTLYGISTGSAVTTTVNITCNDITAEGDVVLKNTDYLQVTGMGDERAFTIIDPHNKVIDASGGDGVGQLSYTARMCVCGKTDGMFNHTANCTQPETAWIAWNKAASNAMHSNYVRLPRNAGSYYLTEDFMNLDVYTEIAAKTVVNLDLAGHVVEGPGKDGLLYRADGGTINITDSSKEKTGAIIATGEITNMPGRVIYVWGNSSNESCVNLFEGKLAVADGATGKDGVVVRILNGKFNMYGGEITPGTCSDVDGSNCIAVGASAKSCVLNVQGGTIKGEIVVNDAAAKITIGGTAKVGIEQPGKAYGIGTSSAVTSTVNITYNNVTSDGEVVLKNTDYLSIASGSTGDESAFTIIDPHNKVVDASGGDEVGELSYAPRMCNCGALENGTHKFKTDGTRACAVPTEIWTAWDTNICKVADKAAYSKQRIRLPFSKGNYYLTENITMIEAVTSNIASTMTINLDLNGKVVTPIVNGGSVFKSSSGSARAIVNITDSVGGGAIRFPQGEITQRQELIRMESDCVFNFFGGILSAEGVVNKYTDSADPAAIITRKSSTYGNFYWYGGRIIKNNTIEHYVRASGFNNVGNLTVETAE